ncbi:MAG: NAD(P)/FAD-dependent oxidoreductase, partial [Salinisphaera sp.]|nr:NAD(P)/FAD-dependent oxidoreductase [Salinisphaera sp.]
MSKSDMAPQQYDAIVVGAGIAGLYTLHRLREMGKKVIAFETGDGVGGTWYWNRYPGARVDSQAYIYQYFFSKELIDEWSWSELFPAQPETERYLNFVADKFDLKKDIQFNTRVDQAVYDEAKRGWQVITDQGDTLFAQHFICCVGMLSAAAALQAPFPGKENFKGMVCHTARWPKEPVDFAGKRVGVVGTGATGIQVIQTVAPQCENLKVFQLVPEYTIPMRNPALVEEDNEAYRKQAMETRSKVRETFAGFSFDFDNGSFYDYSPEQRNKILEQLWAEGSLFFWIGSFFEVFTDEKANEEISEFVRNKIRARIDDPAVAEKLVPTNYGFGTRRVPLDAGYFEAYNRDNVELVDVSGNAIECITENGLKLANGEEHELDILILATGFDGGSGGFTAIDIHGRKGETLKEYWAKDMSTTFGLQV